MNFMTLETNGEESLKPESRIERIGTAIFGCSIENYRALKERIKTSGGKVVLLVHPFSRHDNLKVTGIDNAEFPTDPDLAEKLASTMRLLEEFFADARKSKIPVIVMQENRHMPRRDLYLIGAPEQNIFFIPTRDNDPAPVFTLPGKKYPSADAANWVEAINVFRDLKVNDIELGGMYLWDRKENSVMDRLGLNMNEINGNCVSCMWHRNYLGELHVAVSVRSEDNVTFGDISD